MWGVRDKCTVASYGANILGVREAVPALLDLFTEFEIACTWATVGLLFFAKKEDMLAALPTRLPHYANQSLSPYREAAEAGPDEGRDPYHYGYSLIKKIIGYPAQEVGTHTFSHFYCLEEGGSVEAFRADLQAARAAAARVGVTLASIAFPRNQMSASHLSICRELGLRAFRGNESVWFQRPRPDSAQNLAVRGFRLADSYLPVAGAQDHEPELLDGIVNVPASRFLRAARDETMFERVRLQRITSAMDTAARRATLFHLWWHPHNFGVGLQKNLTFLRAILNHFRFLRDRYEMRSMTMAAVADEIING